MKLKEFNDRLKQEITDEMLEMLAPDQNKWSFPEISF